MSNPAQGAVGAETMTAGSKAVSARTLAGMLRSRIERAAEHKSETVSLGQFFADQIHRYLTEAGHGPEHDARSGDVPADGGDPDCDRGRDWGLRARQVHLEALSKRAAGGKWFASTNGADGLARLDNGTDGMFPVRGEWHEIEFVEALVNAYRNGDLATPAQPAGAVPDSLRALSEAFAETACCASCTTPLDCYQGKPCRLEPDGSRPGAVDHEFKSHPDVFWPAARGEKTFEYRRDDRGGYEVGQTVRLRCYDPTRGYHDTAPLDRRITNILRGGEFELPIGYCILSLAPLASHPAGQSTDDGTDRCEICDKPLIAGQRVMQDVELGTVHAACCGPEREAYVKDVDTGEPLGPNDPIPQGYVYHPAEQSTGSGAEDRQHAAETELQEIQDGAYGNNPMTRGLARDALARLRARDGEDVSTWAQSLGADLARAGEAESAPDSPLTGPVGTERRLIGPTMTPEQEARIAHNLCGEFGPDAVIANAAFAKAFYAELYAAAGPAAPEAQGAWLDIETAEKKPRPSIIVETEITANGCTRKVEFIAHWAEDLSGEEQPPFRGWFYATGYGFAQVPGTPKRWRRLPAPPASSGQGGR